jgi:hypothetical protein
VAAGLIGISVIGLKAGLASLGVLALIVAFSSSTQDIVVDAWRIEAAADGDELGLLSSAYQLGYRFAVLVSDALILIMASHWGWRDLVRRDGRVDGGRDHRKPGRRRAAADHRGVRIQSLHCARCGADAAFSTP